MDPKLVKFYKESFSSYAEDILRIRTKEGAVRPLKLNLAQRYIHGKLENQRLNTGKVRAIIVKGRQQGCSTYIQGRFYWLTTLSQGVRAFILTHSADATANIFDMAQRFHQYALQEVKPPTSADSAKELEFKSIGSGYKVATAGSRAVGRSQTIQLFHGSEVAFWPYAEEHTAGVLQAVPSLKGTEVILESTANGVGNLFYEMVMKATADNSEFQAIFVPWFFQDEYKRPMPSDTKLTEEENNLYFTYKDKGLTPEHLYWRRFKIEELGESLFRQEYPFNLHEAFEASADDVLIPPALAARAAIKKVGFNQLDALRVAGCDPAYSETGDETALVFRQGRIVQDIKRFRGIDTVQTAYECMKAFNEWKLDKLLIDVVGLGIGVYDQLKLNGYSKNVIPVYAGQKAGRDDLFINKRTEMWYAMKEWLEDEPCEIPFDKELIQQLSTPKMLRDARQRMQLEKKEDIKKRGVGSPDIADALALTFAAPLQNTTSSGTIVPHTQFTNYTSGIYDYD